MKIKRIIYKIIDIYDKFKEHPLTKNAPLIALLRYIKFNFINQISNKERIYNWVNGLKFYAKKGDAGIVPNIYFKLFDYEDSMFVLNMINENHLFVDVGSNVGHFTMLAASKGARVIAIEPIPNTFKRLQKNIQLNHLENKIQCFNIGIGKEKETLYFTSSLDVMNRVATQNDKNTIPILVESLNEILKNENPIMIKIDVEGYEWFVLQGAIEVLKKPTLKYILLELNDSSQKFSISNEEIHMFMLDHNFTPVHYDVNNNTLIPQHSYNKTIFNTLYAREN